MVLDRPYERDVQLVHGSGFEEPRRAYEILTVPFLKQNAYFYNWLGVIVLYKEYHYLDILDGVSMG